MVGVLNRVVRVPFDKGFEDAKVLWKEVCIQGESIEINASVLGKEHGWCV